MPRIVDHEQRRRAITDAVWRVIRRDGIAGASVRTVAEEAELSMGSLRHFFPTQDELLAAAMRAVAERIETRVAALGEAADARTAVEQRLQQLLPLDDERRAENEVWLAFCGAALVRPELRAQYQEVHDSMRSACVIAARELGLAEPANAAARLHALIDGLAVHAALQPVTITPRHLRRTLAAHLDALVTARSGAI